MTGLPADKSVVFACGGETFVFAFPLGLALIVKAQTSISAFRIVAKRQADCQR